MKRNTSQNSDIQPAFAKQKESDGGAMRSRTVKKKMITFDHKDGRMGIQRCVHFSSFSHILINLIKVHLPC